MAYKTRNELLLLLADGQRLDGVDFIDLIDSLERRTRTADMSPPETTMKVSFRGDTAPTLTRTAAGNYLLSEPADTVIVGFVWVGTSVTLTGGSVILTIRSADGHQRETHYVVRGTGNGAEVGQLQNVVLNHNISTPGDFVTTFPNVGSVSGDFVITGKVVIV